MSTVQRRRVLATYTYINVDALQAFTAMDALSYVLVQHSSAMTEFLEMVAASAKIYVGSELGYFIHIHINTY